jgi:hypothetical protein
MVLEGKQGCNSRDRGERGNVSNTDLVNLCSLVSSEFAASNSFDPEEY